MELRFGHLCDYAGFGAGGKLILVGLFNQVMHAGALPISLPLSYLVFRVECSIAEGADHEVRVRLKDEDEITVVNDEGEPVDFSLGAPRFTPSGPGRPLGAQVIFQVVGIALPRTGDYAFEIRIDGAIVGEVPLYAVELAPRPPQ
jgi:hypothetical protein